MTGGCKMGIKITGTVKEIADLVFALQGQQKKKRPLKVKTVVTLDGTVLYQAVRKPAVIKSKKYGEKQQI